MLATPVSIFYCPSRRPAQGYPYVNTNNANFIPPPVMAKSDYAASMGDLQDGLGYGTDGSCNESVHSLEAGAAFRGWRYSGPTFVNRVAFLSNKCPTGQTGVVFQRSTIGFHEITDGTAFTYLYGEKTLRVDEYETGVAGNDDQSMYNGFDRDNLASSHVRLSTTGVVLGEPPTPDTPRVEYHWRFGGPHSGGWMSVFCDGSVHFISYDMDPLVHPKLGNRRDGQIVDTSAFD